MDKSLFSTLRLQKIDSDFQNLDLAGFNGYLTRYENEIPQFFGFISKYCRRHITLYI